MSNTFEVGEGPVFFRNITCDYTHSELFQCVHPLSIGLHECDSPDKRAGVICPELASPSTTTISPSISSTLQLVEPSTITAPISGITPSQTTIFSSAPTSNTNISPTTTLVLTTVSACIQLNCMHSMHSTIGQAQHSTLH